MAYTAEQLEKWRKAGRISSEVKAYARSLLKKDVLIVEIVDKIEQKIIDLGAIPAFPVNIGVNEKAAHFTPFQGDKTRIKEDLVKIDLGVAIDGMATDTAFTVDLTKDKRHKKMIDVTERALAEAIKLCRPGIAVREIGKRVHEIITKEGFSPIRNLSGHEIWPYKLHAGLSIPNYDNSNETKLEDGMVLAIEPFATTGEGVVQDGKESGDFSFNERKPIRDAHAREVLKFIEENYSTLPFAGRWIYKKFGQRGIHSLRLLTKEGVLHNYRELIEISRKPVSHFEQTIIVKNKPEIIT